MRVTTKTFVSVATAVGIAAGGLATASTAVAVPAQAQQPVSAEAVAPLAVNNLGLGSRQAKNVQCWLKNGNWGYGGAIDGLLGTNSWKAFQKYLRKHQKYNDSIDGIVGPNTIRALQRLLQNEGWGYTGDIDGIAGDKTKAAFKRFATGQAGFC